MKLCANFLKSGVLVCCAGLILVGCAASGTFGRLELSTAVDRDFENGVVLPGHAYYTTGSENNPDAVIAIGGSWGTLSEIALASKAGKPVVLLGTWQMIPPDRATLLPERATSPEDAVRLALSLPGSP